MTGRVATAHSATAHWRRLDVHGTDRCTLSRADHGWLLTGLAIWKDAREEGELTYAVRCDPDWHSVSADVTGTFGGRDITLRLMRSGDGWTMNDIAQPGLTDCTDIDLSFTPATNLMPLRRLGETVSGPVVVRAAWLVPDLSRLQMLEQTYQVLGDGVFTYASPGFTARIEAHSTGFVTRYGGLWSGWVDE